MDLDKRDRHRRQGIAYGDTGVGKGSGVNDDQLGLVGRLLDALHQFVFGIALQAVQLMTGRLGLLLERAVDVLQGGGAIEMGFPGP